MLVEVEVKSERNGIITLIILFFLAGIITAWIWNLEEQNEMLMSKVTSMQIQVAKCKGER
jgi:hypothetical protein